MKAQFWRQPVLNAKGIEGPKIKAFEYLFGSDPRHLIRTNVVETLVRASAGAPWLQVFTFDDAIYPSLHAALEAWKKKQGAVQ